MVNSDEALARIQAATGITRIEDLVEAFVTAEDQSFSMFNFVNELNQEAERLEEQAVALQQECYFPVGDVSALAERLNAQLTRGKVDYSDYLQRYDWQRIAGQTMAVYRKALGQPAGENQ